MTKEALFAGLAFAKPANRLSDISHAIEKYVLENGYSVVKEFTGHGIGQKLHEDPHSQFREPRFRAPVKGGNDFSHRTDGQCRASETVVLDDDWTTVTRDGSDSAHFEHTIVITDTGYNILTKEGE